MKRNRLALLLVSLVIPACGCAMACGPFDYEYNCYGGTFDRVDRVNGRAGSLSAPAEAVDPSRQKLGKPPAEAAEAAETTETTEAPTTTTSNDRFE
jgi:hypothetical protein